MIEKTVEYDDFNGNHKKKTLYFHMSESDVYNWLATDGDYTLDKVYEHMVETKNGKEIIRTIEDMILRSYGEKSFDGENFDKSPEIVNKFKNSAAYDALFVELLNDSNKASDFFNGILPRKMLEKMVKSVNENPEKFPEDVRNIYIKNDNNSIEVIK